MINPVIRISLLLIIFFLSEPLSAQVNKKKSWNLSLGADVLYSEGSFRKTHNWGYGGTFKAEFLFLNHLSFTLSSGVYNLTGRTTLLNPDAKNVTGIPLKAGLRYYMGNFYIAGEGGGIYQSGFQPGSGVVYAFSIGDELITNKHNNNSLDISFRHEVWVTDRSRAFAGLRLAYEFRLN